MCLTHTHTHTLIPLSLNLSSLLFSLPLSLLQVYCQACLAIRNLASDDENQKRIVDYGGLKVLVPLLRSNDTETVTAAVAALRNLSIHNGNEVSPSALL